MFLFIVILIFIIYCLILGYAIAFNFTKHKTTTDYLQHKYIKNENDDNNDDYDNFNDMPSFTDF